MKSVWENLKGSISLLRGFSPQMVHLPVLILYISVIILLFSFPLSQEVANVGVAREIGEHSSSLIGRLPTTSQNLVKLPQRTVASLSWDKYW